MSNQTPEQWKKLESRARRLAQDKSYLQLLVSMMQQLGETGGLEGTVDALLRLLLEHIGGTNLILYYRVDGVVHYADAYGKKERLASIGDGAVQGVFDSRAPLVLEGDFAETRMQAPEFTKAWTWIYPLNAGAETVAVFKGENLHIGTRDWQGYLPTFFAYAASVLKNEILGHSRLQQAYRELQQRNDELRLKLDTLLTPDAEISPQDLGNIINTPELQSLMEAFYRITHVAMAIVDLQGQVLVGVGWQNVCVKFHRVHPETLKNCLESDLMLTRDVAEGQCLAYKCRNNLWDVSTPLYIGGKHVANIFLGQFFYQDEPPDLAFFAAQADQFGFDKEAYLAAVKEVPLCSRAQLDELMTFYGGFSGLVSKLSFSNVKLARSLVDNRRIEAELRQAKEGLEQKVEERTVALTVANEALGRQVAELHRAQQQLTLERDRAQRYLDTVEVMVVALDCEGRITLLNRKACELLGYEESELLGRNWFDACLPQPQGMDVVYPVFKALMAGNTSDAEDFENAVLTRAGAQRLIAWHNAVLRDAAGHPAGVLGSGEDITERRLAEKAVQESRSYLQTLLHNLPAAVVVHGPDTKVRYANPVALAMLGMSEDQLLGRPGFHPGWHFVRADGSLMPPAEFPVNRVVAERRSLHGYTVGVVRSRGAEPAWVAVSAFPQLDARGELDQVIVCFVDITARKRYEQSLQREAQEWTQAMDVFPDIIYLLDTRRRLMRANRMFYAQTGSDPARAVGKHIVELIHSPGEEKTCPVCLAQEELRDAVLTMEADHPANSTRRPIEVTVKVIRSPSGEPHALLTTIHDQTNARRFEEELRHLNESLERRVLEEVAKNREKDAMLIQQSRLATMGEMMHNVAHQWRQPLSALSLIFSNIKDDYEYGELNRDTLERQVADGLRLAQKMSSTIDDFRDFFRPDHATSRFNLVEAVREALNLVDASFRNNRIEVSQPAAPDVFVEGYPNEYSQVLLNVLSNARDVLSRAPGGGRVTVEIGCDGSDGVVRIRDNGGGIAEDVLPKIFDPYFSTKEKGTGIGLYMSRMIVAHMDGRIEAHNVDGGAEFVISIPLAAEPDRTGLVR